MRNPQRRKNDLVKGKERSQKQSKTFPKPDTHLLQCWGKPEETRHPFSHHQVSRGQCRLCWRFKASTQSAWRCLCPHEAVVIHQDNGSETNLEIHGPLWVQRVVRAGPRFDTD